MGGLLAKLFECVFAVFSIICRYAKIHTIIYAWDFRSSQVNDITATQTFGENKYLTDHRTGPLLSKDDEIHDKQDASSVQSVPTNTILAKESDQFCDLDFNEILNDDDSRIELPGVSINIVQDDTNVFPNSQISTKQTNTLALTEPTLCPPYTCTNGNKQRLRDTCRAELERLTDQSETDEVCDISNAVCLSSRQIHASPEATVQKVACDSVQVESSSKMEEVGNVKSPTIDVYEAMRTNQMDFTPRAESNKADIFDIRSDADVPCYRSINKVSKQCLGVQVNFAVDNTIHTIPDSTLKYGTQKLHDKPVNGIVNTCVTGIQTESGSQTMEGEKFNLATKIRRVNIESDVTIKNLPKPQEKHLRKSKQRRKVKWKKKHKKTQIGIVPSLNELLALNDFKELCHNTKTSKSFVEELNGMKDLKSLEYRHKMNELKDNLFDSEGIDEFKFVLKTISDTVSTFPSYTTSMVFPVIRTDDEAEKRGRLLSFQRYTGNGSSVNLARCGFTCEQGNRTRCHACNLVYCDWEYLENVDERHRRLSPNCPMLHVPRVNGANPVANNTTPIVHSNQNQPIPGNRANDRNRSGDEKRSDGGQAQQRQSAEPKSNARVHQTSAVQPSETQNPYRNYHRTARQVVTSRHATGMRHHQAFQANEQEQTLHLRELREYRRRRPVSELLDTGQTTSHDCDSPSTRTNSRTSRETNEHGTGKVENRSLADYRRKLKEENRELRQMLFCKLCKINESDQLFLPCCHLSVCRACAANIRKCPVCHQEIKIIKRVYRS